ncbi:MAG: hypothetical protein EA405_12175 [Rhodospirillales bacterium]|nr:MAG: hypothetical protein EA405_12175 [Rhodospirillales bacterium]
MRLAATAAAIGIAGMLALSGCDDRVTAAMLPASQCRGLALIDADSGEPLAGIQDLTVDAAAGVAWLAAQDRWAVEAAAHARADALPQGGLYALPLDPATLDSAEVSVVDISRAFKGTRSFHPHGIDLHVGDDGRRTLFVVNRRHVRDGPEAGAPRWAMDPAIEVFDVEGTALVHRHTVEGPKVCHANGVVSVAADRFYVSNDAGACSARGRWLELVTGLDRASVVRVELGGGDSAPRITTVADGIRFANGLAVDENHLYVAATRANAVLVYRRDRLPESDEAKPAATPDSVIPLGAGPDNLSWDGNGRLLAASHPSLFRLALYRYRWWPGAIAPSSVLRVTVADTSVQEVYRSRERPPLLSAATVAAAHGDRLLMGSVTDTGLTVCRYSDGPGNDGGTPSSDVRP